MVCSAIFNLYYSVLLFALSNILLCHTFAPTLAYFHYKNVLSFCDCMQSFSLKYNYNFIILGFPLAWVVTCTVDLDHENVATILSFNQHI
jgi:hypothetical protein